MDVPVWDPMPGLGVTVPVFCAAAMPIDSANTDDANRIFRIEVLLDFDLCGLSFLRAGKIFRSENPANK